MGSVSGETSCNLLSHLLSLSLMSSNCIQSLIILPTDAHDVSIALSFAKDNKLDLAIKGGGHASSGASSSDGGLVIDLSLIKAVTVDAEKKIATVGGGARWEDVDVATAKHGLACVGGTVNE